MSKLDLMELTALSRRTHGLAHGDYSRYSRHCAVKVKKTLMAQRKYSADDTLTLLFKAERDWSRAMDLKATGEPRKRHHAIKKFKRSVQYAHQLSVKLQGSDQELQIQAYTSLMRALLALEQQKYQIALDAFGLARFVFLNTHD